MALMETPHFCSGWQAGNFLLETTDDQTYSLEQIKGSKGTLVMFICNHCPYVKAIADRLAPAIQALQEIGVGVVAILSNDSERYPADHFSNMKIFAEQHNFNFPYCIDRDQSVARAFQAICTPEFFCFDCHLKLKCRGRLDSAGKQPLDDAIVPELLIAMREIAATRCFGGPQYPALGCSIKWKE